MNFFNISLQNGIAKDQSNPIFCYTDLEKHQLLSTLVLSINPFNDLLGRL